MPKVAAKPVVAKSKKNVQPPKKTSKGGRTAAPLQKALKTQKKVNIHNINEKNLINCKLSKLFQYT